jgi:hypothetical protein
LVVGEERYPAVAALEEEEEEAQLLNLAEVKAEALQLLQLARLQDSFQLVAVGVGGGEGRPRGVQVVAAAVLAHDQVSGGVPSAILPMKKIIIKTLTPA